MSQPPYPGSFPNPGMPPGPPYGANGYPQYVQPVGQHPPVPPAYSPYGPPPVRTWLDPSGIVIPESTYIASSGRRIGGFFMEMLLCVVTLFFGYVVWTLVVWGRGQTPGKQVLGMRCYRVDDQRVAHWGWMLLRQGLAYIINYFSFGIAFIVSCFMLVSRTDRRTLPDLIAGTTVLYDPKGVLR